MGAEPYAIVWIDGEQVGTTPLVRHRLPAGEHTIAVEATDDPPGPGAWILDPAGRIIAAEPVPDHPPTGCAFGGPGRDRLYLTTSDGNLLRVDASGRRGADPIARRRAAP